MWIFTLTLFGLGSCFFIALVFGLLNAGRRADEGEERISFIITSAHPDNTVVLEDTALPRYI